SRFDEEHLRRLFTFDERDLPPRLADWHPQTEPDPVHEPVRRPARRRVLLAAALTAAILAVFGGVALANTWLSGTSPAPRPGRRGSAPLQPPPPEGPDPNRAPPASSRRARPPTAPTPTAGMPDATNTGVPAGTRLTTHHGDLHITTAGAVVDALLVI